MNEKKTTQTPETLEHPFETPTEHRDYAVFSEGFEKDPEIFFHGTGRNVLEAILEEGFTPPAPPKAQSVSFSRTSGLALGYACDKRSDASPEGVVIAVRFSAENRSGGAVRSSCRPVRSAAGDRRLLRSAGRIHVPLSSHAGDPVGAPQRSADRNRNVTDRALRSPGQDVPIRPTWASRIRSKRGTATNRHRWRPTNNTGPPTTGREQRRGGASARAGR